MEEYTSRANEFWDYLKKELTNESDKTRNHFSSDSDEWFYGKTGKIVLRICDKFRDFFRKELGFERCKGVKLVSEAEYEIMRGILGDLKYSTPNGVTFRRCDGENIIFMDLISFGSLQWKSLEDSPDIDKVTRFLLEYSREDMLEFIRENFRGLVNNPRTALYVGGRDEDKVYKKAIDDLEKVVKVLENSRVKLHKGNVEMKLW